jgi:hypothetical protein
MAMTPWPASSSNLSFHRLQLGPFVLAKAGGGGLTIIESLEKEI